jgi:hypothetical protein
MSNLPANAAEIAQTAIINAGSKLNAGIALKTRHQGLKDSHGEDERDFLREGSPCVLYGALLHEFQHDCNKPLMAMEDYGSEVSFASAVECFLAVAVSWNKHVFECIQLSRGEISRQKTLQGVENITAVVYECCWNPNVRPHLQDFDCFGQSIQMFITSPLRSVQSMHYVLDYYETLVAEVRSSITHLTNSSRIRQSDRQLCEERVEYLETILKQIERGFEEEEVWWESKRPLSSAAALRRQQLNEARSNNEKLRLKFRKDDSQHDMQFEKVDTEAARSPLVPFAVIYEDQNFMSTALKDETPKCRPWPRISAKWEVMPRDNVILETGAAPRAEIKSTPPTSQASNFPDCILC